MAFSALLFFLSSPGTPLPTNPLERSAFRIPVHTDRALDLTTPPLDADRDAWTHPTGYTRCEDLGDLARSAAIEAIRYESIRDPVCGANLVLPSPAALGATTPDAIQTWHILLRRDRADALREIPRSSLSIPLSTWAAVDSRVPAVIRA